MKINQFPERTTKNGVKYRDYFFIYEEENPKQFVNKCYNSRINNFTIIKKVDQQTANRLYGRLYNPISIFVVNYSGKPMIKAMIHSVDDSSFGIWWNKNEVFSIIKKQLFKYLKSKQEVNGKEFLNKCISLGADPKTIDYN